MDKYQMVQYNHSNIQDLIRFMDQKAGALLVVYGFILTTLIESTKNLKLVNPFEFDSLSKSIVSSITFILGAWLLFILLYQIYVVLYQIIKPRKAKNYSQEEVSTNYYIHISQTKKEKYIESYFGLTSEKAEKELLDQVYEIACILDEKSKRFNVAIKLLYQSILILLTFIFLTKIL